MRVACLPAPVVEASRLADNIREPMPKSLSGKAADLRYSRRLRSICSVGVGGFAALAGCAIRENASGDERHTCMGVTILVVAPCAHWTPIATD